jgi:hypothetical protein
MISRIGGVRVNYSISLTGNTCIRENLVYRLVTQLLREGPLTRLFLALVRVYIAEIDFSFNHANLACDH